jgi:cytoskeletal protein CcmA (bactofilin family)
MVFNRKPDASPPEIPQPRRGERLAGGERPYPQSSAQTSFGADGQSVIGNDLSIEGQAITIRCKGSLRVFGSIEADVHSRQLEIGKEATIQGTVAAETVDVHGRVQGVIMGDHVVLHATAAVEGDIHSHLLSIEQGAAFDGRSRRVANPAEVAPQLERASAQASSNNAAPSSSQFERAAQGLASRLHS